MSQVDRGSEAPIQAGATSSWAVASLLCSVGLCCPLLSLVGILLGLRAMVQIKATPGLGGMRFARAGIALGAAGLLGWIGAAAFWHFNARLPMMHGPREELKAGLAGDVARFKAGFTTPGATAPDAEAQEFLRELGNRYGTLVTTHLDTNSATKVSLQGPAQLQVDYVLQFDRQNVPAQATFMTFGPSRLLPNPVFKWDWIRVIDPQKGDLVYPSSARAAATANPTGP